MSIFYTILANVAVFVLVATLLFIADRQEMVRPRAIFVSALSASYLFWFFT